MKNKILALLVLLVPLFCTAQTKWYRTQAGTGLGNCGPAVVAMAIAWTQSSDITVAQVRKEIGYTGKDGGTSFEQLIKILEAHNVDNTLVKLQGLAALRDLIELPGVMAIVMLNPSLISKAKDGYYGRTYYFDGQHYIVLEAIESEFFVVQDPMPKSNDRRYLIEEVWAAMKDKRVIIIRNPNGIKDYN